MVPVQNEDGTKVAYRGWNPFSSKLAAAILGGLDAIWMARILAMNASYFLKSGGHFVISIKANYIDSTVPAEAVFAQGVKLQAEQFKDIERSLSYLLNGTMLVLLLVGIYHVPKKQKPAAAAS
ncbi:hypothetical protein U1Q18_004616 [Sarracenia purpurea var. burkii]